MPIPGAACQSGMRSVRCFIQVVLLQGTMGNSRMGTKLLYACASPRCSYVNDHHPPITFKCRQAGEAPAPRLVRRLHY